MSSVQSHHTSAQLVATQSWHGVALSHVTMPPVLVVITLPDELPVLIVPDVLVGPLVPDVLVEGCAPVDWFADCDPVICEPVEPGPAPPGPPPPVGTSTSLLHEAMRANAGMTASRTWTIMDRLSRSSAATGKSARNIQPID